MSKSFYFPKSAEHNPQANAMRLDLTLTHESGKIKPILSSLVYDTGIAAQDNNKTRWWPATDWRHNTTVIHPEILADLVEELISIEHKNGR